MAIWDRYKQATTGLETKAFLGDIFTIRSYCDDPLGGVFVSKEPVCKLLVTPFSVFINTDFGWDISDSISSTGTIDTFDIDYDGATSGGDISAGDWAVDPLSGTNQYTAKGHFTIVASVTDTLGNKSKEVRIPIHAIDGTSEIVESLQRVYLSTTDDGCWTMTPTDAPAASNTGLSGDDLKFRDMRLSPYTADDENTKHLLLAATKNGLAYTVDGAANWDTISKATLGTPKNTVGDSPAPVTTDLDQIGVSFDPQSALRWYVLRTTATRTWIYWSDNPRVTWDNEQVIGALAYGTTAKFITSTSTSGYTHSKLSAEKTICCFTDTGNTTFSAVVIEGSTDPVTFGAQSDITAPGISDGVVDAFGTDKAVIAYRDADDTDKGKARVLTVVTTTITQQAATTFDSGAVQSGNVKMALTSDGALGCIAYRVSSIFKLVRFSVSGNTITADAAVTHGTHSTGFPIAMTAFGATKVLLWYRVSNTDYHAQVLDLDGSLTQATQTTVPKTPSAGVGGWQNIIALSDILAVVAFEDDDVTNTTHLATLTRSEIDDSLTLGTLVDLDTNAEDPPIDKISETSFVVSWFGDDTRTIEIFDIIAGISVSRGIGVGGATWAQTPVITQGSNNQGIIVYEDSDDGYAIPFFNSPLTHSAGGIPGSILI